MSKHRNRNFIDENALWNQLVNTQRQLTGSVPAYNQTGKGKKIKVEVITTWGNYSGIKKKFIDARERASKSALSALPDNQKAVA